MSVIVVAIMRENPDEDENVNKRSKKIKLIILF
jgi:hypothetical protein